MVFNDSAYWMILGGLVFIEVCLGILYVKLSRSDKQKKRGGTTDHD